MNWKIHLGIWSYFCQINIMCLFWGNKIRAMLTILFFGLKLDQKSRRVLQATQIFPFGIYLHFRCCCNLLSDPVSKLQSFLLHLKRFLDTDHSWCSFRWLDSSFFAWGPKNFFPQFSQSLWAKMKRMEHYEM